MFDDLFDLVDEEVEEAKPKEKVKSKVKEPKKEKKKEGAKKSTSSKYKYPFIMHIAARNIDVSHIFEEGKEYTAQEITKAMLEHQFYDFAGEVTYEFMESDNVLLPIFRQHKKG